MHTPPTRWHTVLHWLDHQPLWRVATAGALLGLGLGLPGFFALVNKTNKYTQWYVANMQFNVAWMERSGIRDSTLLPSSLFFTVFGCILIYEIYKGIEDGHRVSLG